MNKLTKKLLCSAVATGTLLSAVPSFAAIPADVEGTRFEEPVQILSALGIMNGDENGKFRLDDTIIRSEVTKMAVHAMGLESAADSSKGQSNFSDVAADHWANGYINIATSLKLIEGDGDGKFRPNDTITYAEAMAIMIRATGYTIAANDKGGYPNGYMAVGTSNGFANNVKCGQSEKISRGNVAYLTSNALEVKLMEQKGFGTNSSYEITEKTLLKDNLKVTKEEGQITAVEKASLAGSSSLNKGQVTLGSTTYDTQLNMSNLLGYNVTGYIKEASVGNDELILALPIANKNTSVKIDSESFSKLTEKNGNNAIVYFTDTNNSKTATVELAKEPIMIYNGKYEKFDLKQLDMSDENGHLTLLDADKDGKYEIVFVTKYDNIVVEEVTGSNKISDKYGNAALKLDDDVDYTLTMGYNEIAVSDLKEYDVLSVAKSLDGELYTITVTRNPVDGKVTAVDDTGVYIADNHYKIAKNYTESVNIGLEGTFYLDAEGKIAAVDTTKRLSSNYAYLIRAYTNTNTDESTMFRLFTKEGKEVTVEANEKIKFNGKSGVKAKDAVKSLTGDDSATVRRLVTYSVNSSGKLTVLDTAKDNTSNGAIDIENFTMNYSLKNAQYSAATSKLGNVRITNDTVIFEITEDSADYSIRQKDVFEDEQNYDAEIYDMTENYTAKVVVLTNSAVKANADSSLAVVKKIVKATNSEDEETDMLQALSGGKEVSVFAESENILVKGDSKKLEAGDLIQYRTNSKGEITSIRVLMDIQNKDTESLAEPVENLKTVYGKVTKKFTNTINVTVNDGGVVNYELPENVKVYEVDTTISKNNINTASVKDIQNYDADDNNRVFIKLYKDVVQEVVIIK